MTDIWVCANCHSINRQRTGKCYKCGAKQDLADTGDMSNLRQEQAIISRTVVAYRPARTWALVTAFLLLVFAGATIGRVLFSIEFTQFFTTELERVVAGGTLNSKALADRALEGLPYLLVQAVVVLPLLLFFAMWLSRVVSNVPALGGGIPNTTPGRAFVFTLVPVVNLLKVPGIIQDVLYRLDPRGGGLFMVGIAWFGLVGSAIISFVAGWYLNLRTTFDTAGAASPAKALEALRPLITASTIVEAVSGFLIAIGSLVLILLMVRIERRSRARDAEVRDAAGV